MRMRSRRVCQSAVTRTLAHSQTRTIEEVPIASQDTRSSQRKNPYREQSGAARLLTWLLRLVLLFAVLTGCLTAALVLYSRWLSSGQDIVRIEGGSSDLSIPQQLYLQVYLSARAQELQEPAGTASAPVHFTIEPGATADVVAANLAAAGLLADPELFLNYAHFYGLDARFEAGDFTLSPQLTIPELATALTRAQASDVNLRFIEGWRFEEMAGYLQEVEPALIVPADFLAIARGEAAFDTGRYAFLASLPAGATLEGFLFPDTYHVPRDANAAYLVDLMLENFGRRVTPAMRQAYGARGLSLREAVTLASIVEREAAVPGERPIIASVFYNRLAQGMMLQADPTVQYPLGYQPDLDTWWKSPLSLADLESPSLYNTYVYTGLPPGPIANPGLASLQAVAEPAATDYLFFVVDCTTAIAGSHIFSVTYEEHLAHVERCR